MAPAAALAPPSYSAILTLLGLMICVIRRRRVADGRILEIARVENRHVLVDTILPLLSGRKCALATANEFGDGNDSVPVITKASVQTFVKISDIEAFERKNKLITRVDLHEDDWTNATDTKE